MRNGIFASNIELIRSGFSPLTKECQRMVRKKGLTLVVAHHVNDDQYILGLIRNKEGAYNGQGKNHDRLPLEIESLDEILDFVENYSRVKKANLRMLNRESEELYNAYCPKANSQSIAA